MLVAHVEQDGVWRVRGGMHEVALALAQLAASLGVEFRLGEAVAQQDLPQLLTDPQVRVQRPHRVLENDADAAPTNGTKDTKAGPSDGGKEADAPAAENGKDTDAPPARKRGVSKVLSLFASPNS